VKTAPAYDAIQVGYGPVGQFMAAKLGQQGHRVAVFDRHRELYQLSRAVHCDDEILRMFQQLGFADRFELDACPMPDYDWFAADMRLLLHLDWSEPGPCGWLGHYFFYQPYLEQLLDGVVREQPTVEVHRGWEVEEVSQDEGAARLVARDRATGEVREFSGRYLLGADGANSLVRETAGIGLADLGFEADWLVIDLRPTDPDVAWPMIESGQYCDPARPTTMFRWLGRTHCRWEFMLLPGEDPAEMEREETCWELLRRWGPAPETAELTRHTVYRFRSLVAERWRSGRHLLLGDSAHLTPPFLGQGMCSGLRDALNLAWKLDLVLRGVCDESLLDGYEAERRPHVTELIEQAIELGKILCVTDPAEATARDERYLHGNPPPPPPFPRLTDGVLQRRPDGAVAPGAGSMSIQSRVRHGGRAGRFDDVVGTGWVLLSRRDDAVAGLSGDQREILAALGATSVRVTPAAIPGAVVDLDHAYARWLHSLGAEVVLIRPDMSVFGCARTADEVPALVDQLAHQLRLRPSRMAATPQEKEPVHE
jgi:2-polyprenyl-6-methoxyphenol hydroxylase-like FAD-dependent oxidoreductase